MRFIKIIIQSLLILITLCWISTSFAQVANDQGNYLGDRIRFLVDIPVITADTLAANTPGANAPAVNAPGANAPVVNAPAVNAPATKNLPVGTELQVIYQDSTYLFVKIKTNATVCTNKTFNCNITYAIKLTDAEKSGMARTGFTYGALVVPFKYQLSGDKAFTGSATLGGYVGYRFMTIHELAITATPIAFAGASNISVSGTSGTSNAMGFSWGIGVVVTLKGAFQLGGVIGCDSVNSSANYEYNNRPWAAFEIGYSFLQ